MWIRRRLDRMLARLGLWLTAKLANEEVREKSLAKAEVFALNERLFVPFDHRAAQTFKFESDYANVLVLTATLRAASFALAHGKQFDVARLSTSSRTLSVEDFFLDEQQRYIAASLAVTHFKREALAFLELYFAIEKVDYGIPNFNHRVLSKLVRSCTATARTLKEFSL